MATATAVLLEISEGELDARLEVDYDDTTDPVDPDLILFRLVNNMTRTCFVLIERSGGQKIVERSVAAGETATQAAGGQVKTLSDAPRIMLVTR